MIDTELVKYQAEMEIVKKMFLDSIIDEDDYLKAEAYLAKKHSQEDKSINRLNNLICTHKYGMYVCDRKECRNGGIYSNCSPKEVRQID